MLEEAAHLFDIGIISNTSNCINHWPAFKLNHEQPSFIDCVCERVFRAESGHYCSREKYKEKQVHLDASVCAINDPKHVNNGLQNHHIKPICIVQAHN
eukprot:6100726-Ditylum_brightwellii.AAC.2